jgi:hypothetical protein
MVALEAWEEVVDGPAEEGPARGPWGVSSAAVEVCLLLPAPLVEVTGLEGKAGGPLTAFGADSEDILLSSPPDLNKFISSSSSSSWSSSQGDLASAPYLDIMHLYCRDCPKSKDDGG